MTTLIEDRPPLTLVHVPRDKLENGKRYIVDMKHGFIEGAWDAKRGYFEGYYWTDISFDGEAYEFAPTLLSEDTP